MKNQSGGVDGGIDGGVDGGIDKVYKCIKANPNIKVKEIHNKLSIPLRTIERYIKILKNKDLIKYKGSPKFGGYFTIKP